MTIEDFDPRQAFAGYEDILPVCPCGCESKRAAGYRIGKEMGVPDYVKERLGLKSGDTIQLDQWTAAEAAIIRNEEWVEEPLVHTMRHIKLAMPWVTHDPYLIRNMRESLSCEERGLKFISNMGHASSAKTNFMAVEAFHLLDVWREECEVFCGSPYKTSASYVFWNRFSEYAAELKRKSKSPFLRNVWVTRNYISFIKDKSAGTGTIQLISYHDAAVIKGLKRPTGRLLILSDEISEYPSDEILKALGNLVSQDTLRVRTSCNFESVENLEGNFHEPKDGSFTNLKREEDLQWDTQIGGSR